MPREKRCQDGDVFLCAADGASFRLLEECTGERTCDPDSLSCRAPTCEPGTLDCSGSRVTACNDEGAGFDETGLDCAAQMQTCIQGECHDIVCKPGTTTCVDNAVYHCQPNQVDQLPEACPVGTHCQQLATDVANCAPNNCVAKEKVCDNGLLKTCSAEGALPATGKDCGDKVCEDGACKPVVCELLKQLCVDGHVHECASPGARTQLIKLCPEGQTCGLLADTVQCLATPCAGSSSDCLGNARGTCAVDGMSLSEVAENCAATKLVCDANAACAASAVDTQGKAEEVEQLNQNVAGNVIDVHSNRRVTKLEANLLLEAPRDLRWIIFEWTGTTFEMQVMEITSNNEGSGFFASSPLDFELKAGKRYLVGVGLVVGDGYLYYDAPPWTPSLSFGGALGGSLGGYSASYQFEPFEKLYRLRITSELP